jgi:hypothetical protein
MQPKAFLKRAQLIFGWFVKADPDEFGAILRAVNGLIEGDSLDPMPIAIEIGRNNAHESSFNRYDLGQFVSGT